MGGTPRRESGGGSLRRISSPIFRDRVARVNSPLWLFLSGSFLTALFLRLFPYPGGRAIHQLRPHVDDRANGADSKRRTAEDVAAGDFDLRFIAFVGGRFEVQVPGATPQLAVLGERDF